MYQAEILQRYWLPLALAENITDKPQQFRLLGDTLVAYRDAQGVVVMKDMCIHRGAALSAGWLEDGNITCPYHGWQYNRTGQCVAIPSLAPGEKIPANAKAIVHTAREAYGLVWVCQHPEPPEFPAWPDDAWNRDDYRVFRVGEYVWQANAARIIENALDFSHFNIAHKGLTELSDGASIKRHDVKVEGSDLKLAYEDGHLRREYTLHFPFCLHDRKSVINVSGGQTWSEGDTSKAGDITSITFIASPIAETETRIFVFISRNHSLDQDDQQFTSRFDEVMDQDRAIVESQRPQVIPPNMASEFHVRYADLGAIAYRRMFAAPAAAAVQVASTTVGAAQ